MDVILASCRRLPEPDLDAAPLGEALRAAGISYAVHGWDEPGVDWSAGRLTVLRSTWNYPVDRDAFLDWSASVDAVSELWNPLALIRWNSHKRYLVELERRGLAVAPTELLAAGTTASLREIVERRGWTSVVVKPAVSAASFATRRFDGAAIDAGEDHLTALLDERDVLVQRYLPSVESHGERALIWIDGTLTHAVRKTPRFEGDDESVSPTAVPISDAEADLARRVLAVVDPAPMYARIDMAPGPDDTPVLMELELIEPSLFFPQCPTALTRFIAALQRRLTGDIPLF